MEYSPFVDEDESKTTKQPPTYAAAAGTTVTAAPMSATPETPASAEYYAAWAAYYQANPQYYNDPAYYASYYGSYYPYSYPTTTDAQQQAQVTQQQQAVAQQQQAAQQAAAAQQQAWNYGSYAAATVGYATATAPPRPAYNSVAKPSLPQPKAKPQQQPPSQYQYPPLPSQLSQPTPKNATPKASPKKADTKSQPTAPQPASSADDAPDKWPPSLRSYIERAFSKCLDDSARNLMEGELKKVITSAIAKKELKTKDWAKEPLPSLPGQKNNINNNNKLNNKLKKSAEEVKPKETKKQQQAKKKKPTFTFEETPLEEERREQRARRFTVNPSAGRAASNYTINDYSSINNIVGDDDMDWDSLMIRGTCTNLEKKYFRLTSAPDPSTVRPEQILMRSLAMLKTKWLKNPDYAYICEQLKSIRQDLTLQRIKNKFTVEVYETHARLALENRDIGEFNQCQTQLHELYRQNIGKSNYAEFVAYRILYFVHLDSQTDLMRVVAGLTPEARTHKSVAHALKIRQDVALMNYHSFFKLYTSTPNMGAYIIDHFVGKMRFLALKLICKSYRPTVPISWVATEMAFNNLEETMSFLTLHKVVLTADAQNIDTRATTLVLPELPNIRT